MTDEEKKPHSAEYFGEYRDFWWNQDFLELMSTRLNLKRAKVILDVGCGIGHWGQLLAPVLSGDSRVIGVDREKEWVAKATERAKIFGLADRYTYQIGDVTALPFGDNQFDLVTCQTVMIHLKDPKAGLREMLRVLKPGGLLLVAEPNNFSNRASLSSLTERQSVDEIVDRLRFGLMVERGKQAMGLGFNSVGDLIPGYIAELEGEQIKVYMSDKAVPFFPPYLNKEQQVNIQQVRDWTKRGFIGWDREEVLGYFLAGGGRADEFERYFDLHMRENEAMIKAVDKGTYSCSGGSVTYLISARKRAGSN
jgi:ubiquinone/menaquinone biosynthesis C-methylase UbiE